MMTSSFSQNALLDINVKHNCGKEGEQNLTCTWRKFPFPETNGKKKKLKTRGGELTIRKEEMPPNTRRETESGKKN